MTHSAHDALDEVDHRPWPLPRNDWSWRQTWHDLLFMHWPVPVAALEPHIPTGLALDRFDGVAWVGVVPFRMSGVTPRGFPALPGLSAFPEINVRTYVTAGGRRGVMFLTLDAASWWAVKAARRFFHLPYFHARMSCQREGDAVSYSSVRREGPAAEFKGRYGADGPAVRTRPGSLEHWLTERYSLYATDQKGGLHTAEIHHRPWPLQGAFAEIERDSMLAPFGISVSGEPILHFASVIQVAIWSLRPLVLRGAA